MKSCADYQGRLPLYPYGELSLSEQDEIREHLAGCPACANAAGRLMGWMEDVRRNSRVDAAPAFWEAYRRRLRNRLEAGRTREPRPALWRPSVLVPLALVLTGGIGFLLATHFGGPRPPVESQINEPVPGEALELARNLDVLENLTFLERMDALEEHQSSGEGEVPTHQL